MPLADRVEVIKNITVPSTKKQLRSFVGLRYDIWQQISELLSPLSSMTYKLTKLNRNEEYQAIFATI